VATNLATKELFVTFLITYMDQKTVTSNSSPPLDILSRAFQLTHALQMFVWQSIHESHYPLTHWLRKQLCCKLQISPEYVGYERSKVCRCVQADSLNRFNSAQGRFILTALRFGKLEELMRDFMGSMTSGLMLPLPWLEKTLSRKSKASRGLDVLAFVSVALVPLKARTTADALALHTASKLLPPLRGTVTAVSADAPGRNHNMPYGMRDPLVT